MNTKLKMKKKKTREREVKKKILVRRNAEKKQAKIKRETEKVDRNTRERLTPFMKEETSKKVKEQRDLEINAQLKHNAEVLKALEEKYFDSVERKRELNVKLEAEGHMNLKEKIDALESKKNDILGVSEEIEAELKSEELKSKINK